MSVAQIKHFDVEYDQSLKTGLILGAVFSALYHLTRYLYANHLRWHDETEQTLHANPPKVLSENLHHPEYTVKPTLWIPRRRKERSWIYGTNHGPREGHRR